MIVPQPSPELAAELRAREDELRRSRGHVHGEAWCLMAYRADDGTETEVVWNSRDGVTPFVITLRSGKQATHVAWGNDVRKPDYRPTIGDRIFIDLTLERARELAAERVEEYWDHPDYPMRSRYANKDAAGEVLAADYYGDGHSPYLAEVVAR